MNPENKDELSFQSDRSSTNPAEFQFVSQSQAEQLQSKRPFELKNFIKPGLILLAAAAAIAILIASLVAANVISFGRFKTITYDNGKGSSFHMKFYGKYSIRDLPKPASSAAASTDQQRTQQLLSKVSVDGKSPFGLSISKIEQTAYDRYKDCDSLTKVISVNNDILNQTVSVCDAGGSAGSQYKNSVYIAPLKSKDAYYLVLIAEDFDTDISTPQKASQLLQKTDLSVYKSDLETIIASIKPL